MHHSMSEYPPGPSSSAASPSSSSNRLFNDRCNKSFTALLQEENNLSLDVWQPYEAVVEIDQTEEMDTLVDKILCDEDCFEGYVAGQLNFDQLLERVSGSLDQQVIPDDDDEVGGAGGGYHTNSDSEDPPPIRSSRIHPRRDAGLTEEDGMIPVKRRRKKTDLSPELAKLIGAAEMLLIEDKLDEAKEVCNKVCQQAPVASEPYYVLADIFFRQGNYRAQLQCLKISAALDPQDTVKWRQLLDIAESNGSVEEAIAYCSKILYVEKSNLAIREKWIALHEAANHVKPALLGKLSILRYCNLPNPLTAVEEGRALAKTFCSNMDYKNAIKTYLTLFERFSNFMKEDDENDAVNLMLYDKQPKQAIKFLATYCGINFRSATSSYKGKEELDRWNEVIVKVTFSEVKAPDILAKAFIALLQLGFCQPVEEHLPQFLSKSDLESCGDWFFEMAEAYASEANNNPNQSIHLLLRLTETQNNNKDLVWLLLAQCYAKLDQYESSVLAYERCIQLAPQNTQALLELVELHRSHNHIVAGMDILRRNLTLSFDAMDPQRLVRYCDTVAQLHDWNEYIRAAWELLFGIWCRAALPAALWQEICQRPNIHLRFEVIQHCLRQDNSAIKQLEFTFERKLEQMGLSVSVMWDIFLQMMSLFHSRADWESMETAAAIGYNLSVYRNRDDWGKRLMGMLVMSGLNNHHYTVAYKLISTLCVENPYSNAAWNFFNVALTTRVRERYDKLITRERKKNPQSLPLEILNAHTSLCSQSYRAAIGAYVLLSEKNPNEPLFALCSAICCLSISCQRLVASKHRALTQGIGFLCKYAQLRGNQLAEVQYNIGRFFHHVSLNHMAVPYYERVLTDTPQLFSDPADQELADVSKEAAFNLMLLYKKSDNRRMAAYIMQKYLVI